jgi:hypothetical protein
MIDACRMAGFKMTHAKMSVFIVADFCDRKGKPLVALRGGDPEELVSGVRNATGVIDLRPRAMWREWSCIVPVQFNADQFALVDIVNLLSHAGIAVGIGEGRPFSRNSAGCGWGTFGKEIQEKINNIPVDLIKKVIPDYDPTKVSFVKGKGCSHCGNTGYRSRISIAEAVDFNQGAAGQAAERHRRCGLPGARKQARTLGEQTPQVH